MLSRRNIFRGLIGGAVAAVWPWGAKAEGEIVNPDLEVTLPLDPFPEHQMGMYLRTYRLNDTCSIQVHAVKGGTVHLVSRTFTRDELLRIHPKAIGRMLHDELAQKVRDA